MADVINLGDVSTKDTGAGSKLKTGNLKRSYNMPRECVEKLVKKGWSRAKAHKYCYSGQKDEVGTDRAKSANVRMQKNLNKQASY
jgi:hypothetical protein|tara:strand:+ start:468 stop:722 length:255 start_codon:yes stop_codon:yes gene_type:complete